MNGERTRTFRDALVAIALSPADNPVELTVLRADADQPLTFSVEPLPASESALRVPTIGVPAATSATIWPTPLRASERELLRLTLERAGLEDVRPGSTLVAVDGAPLPERRLPDAAVEGETFRLFADVEERLRHSDADRVTLTFTSPDGETTNVTAPVERRPDFGVTRLPAIGDEPEPLLVGVEHVLGLTPLIGVAPGVSAETSPRQGLEPGDVIVRVGGVSYPTIPAAMREIRGNADGTVELVVLRQRPGDITTLGAQTFDVDHLTVSVSELGRIGFTPTPATWLPLLGATPELFDAEDRRRDTPASRLGLDRVVPGTLVTTVGGRPVDSLRSIHDAILHATRDAHTNGEAATVDLEAVLLQTPPLDADTARDVFAAAADAQPITLTLELNPQEVAALHALGKHVPNLRGAFRVVQTVRRADGPVAAVGMGAHATKRIILQTYLTLRRLVEGTVPVNQLQGPVGITYTGSRIAEQGVIYVFFFMALISANLAVINFLPIPITDGGQFLLLCYEAVMRKPLPVVAQNVLTLIGLIAIGAVFLYVTFHDILRIF